MTPDELPADMEAIVSRLEVAAIDPAPWPDLRALLKAYQEQRRALEAASPVVPVGVSEVLDAAAAYLKEQYGASHGLDHPVDRARILAALRPTDTGWRDIATAPRDGTRLVLWDLSRAVFGSWRVDEGVSSKEPMWLDESYDDYSCGFASNPLEPTYWMPIPPAPTDTGRE